MIYLFSSYFSLFVSNSFYYLQFYISGSLHHCQSIVLPKLQEMIPTSVLGPAPGINDKILNWDTREQLYSTKLSYIHFYILSSLFPYPPNLFQDMFSCFLPENISEVLYVLVNILFPLTEGTVFPSPDHVTFLITSHWSIMLKLLWLFSRSVLSNSLRPHGLQHARLLSPSLCSEVCSNSCPLSWWRYLTDDIILFRDVSRNY